MKIAVFTSNQPRHVSLACDLAEIADEVFVVQECVTVFPGQVDDFFRKSRVMQRYFEHVIGAERKVFGDVRFARPNVRHLAIKIGDLNKLALSALAPVLDADAFVVFGSSFIKGPLCNHLIERRAINIHMGLSPYYRGNSCNFWALYDGRPDMVGATIHLLSRRLDSGDTLFHALPKPQAADPFVYGMLAVRAAHAGLVQRLASGELLTMPAIPQNRADEVRYTRNADFTDAVAAEYLSRLPTPDDILEATRNGGRDHLIKPVFV